MKSSIRRLAESNPRYIIKDAPRLGYAEVFRPCSTTGEMYTVTVLVKDLLRWKSGRLLAQEAFYYLTPEQREFLITDTTPGEWNEMWKGIEEE